MSLHPQVGVLRVWSCAAQQVASPGSLLRARSAWSSAASLTSSKGFTRLPPQTGGHLASPLRKLSFQVRAVTFSPRRAAALLWTMVKMTESTSVTNNQLGSFLCLKKASSLRNMYCTTEELEFSGRFQQETIFFLPVKLNFPLLLHLCDNAEVRLQLHHLD